jgi:predicted Ser/Thr protein kinase
MNEQTVSHYNILEKLGEGGMGIVYKAEDTKLKRTVALKFLPPGLTGVPELKKRFFIEAQAAAALNHANIVTVYEIDECDKQFYLAMEYVRGKNLREKIDSGPLGIDKALKIAIQSTEGLSEAHKKGIIHRDIKSANIMINEKGQVKVLDFGLARLEGHTRVTNASITVGTAAYMSPEQSRGDKVDHRTDIWSLGVVLYEMVTGELPFKGDYQAAVIYSIMNEDPEPITSLRGDVGESLERIVTKALEKNPDQRYQVMEDLLMDLRALLGEMELVPGVLPAKRRTVGREKEHAQLQEGLQTVFAGQGLLMCVAGEPGIGKTTLVNEFLAEVSAAARPCTIAQGHCSERLAGTGAYLPFLEMLESLIKNRANGSTAKMMRDKAPWWYAQVASFSIENPPDNHLMEEVKTATRERVKRELAAFLQEVSRPGPVVLLFEDLHWADISSIDMLSYLATKFDTMRLLVVATYRPEDLMLAKHPFLQIKPDLLSRGRCREIFPGFLRLEDIESYLALEFPGHDFPADFSVLIHNKTEGSPLFMAALVQDFQNRELIVEKNGCWSLMPSTAEIKLGLPESVQGMIQRKIDQLNENDRRMLEAAAVQGFEFDSAVVAAVLGLDIELVEDRLDELERVHDFVRFIDEQEFPDRSLTMRCQFVHVLYQNQLFSSLTRTKQARLSKAVAEALLGYYREQSSGMAAQLAVLLASAKDNIRAAHYFCLATQNAAQVFAYQEAISQGQRALELLETLPDSPGKTQQEIDLKSVLAPVLMAASGDAAPEKRQTYTRARKLHRLKGQLLLQQDNADAGSSAEKCFCRAIETALVGKQQIPWSCERKGRQ